MGQPELANSSAGAEARRDSMPVQRPSEEELTVARFQDLALRGLALLDNHPSVTERHQAETRKLIEDAHADALSKVGKSRVLGEI